MTNDNENSAVFSSRQNSCSDDAARIEDGKPFQALAAATGKERSLMAQSIYAQQTVANGS